MIVPEIRAFHSPDVADLASFRPEDDSFRLLVQMFTGPRGGEGEESFDFEIVSPAWLERRYAPDGFVSIHRRMLVFVFDWSQIERHLRQRVAGCAGPDWEAVAAKLSRFSYWEFEDYPAER